MKRIISLISLLMCLSMLLASCGGDTIPSSISSDNNSSTVDTGAVDSGTVDSTTVDSSAVDSSTVDSTTIDSSTVDSSTVDSSTADSSTVDSGTTDSSKPDPVPDPEPEIPDGPIEIAVGGETQYVVVYDDSSVAVSNFAQKFVDYMSSTHKITLDMLKASIGTTHDYCIYIGDIDGAQRAKAKFNSTNDFGAVVSGNDYVLYATDNRFYDYLYDVLTSSVLTSIRNGNWSTRPAKNFVYHSSDRASVSYYDYLVEKNGGKFNIDVMIGLFEECAYTTGSTTLPYRMYVPLDYDASKSYPVLTILHGANDRGTNNNSQLRNMVFNLFNNKENPIWDSIVICPQCPSGNQWVDTPWKQGDYRIENVPESNELSAVVELLDKVEVGYSTDTNRYYVTGLSMGGFGTWDLIMRHPDRFAAAVPICGGADQTQAYKLVNKPIYTVHGSIDYDVPTEGTRVMVEAILALGGEMIIYEELQGYAHNVWDYTAVKLEVWQWLFSQSLANQ